MTKLFSSIAFGVAALSAVTMAATPASAADRRIWLNNNTSQSIWEVHYARAGTRDPWSGDLLPSDRVIHSGYRQLQDFGYYTGACVLDFKFVMSDGSERTAANVNVCTNTNLDVID